VLFLNGNLVIGKSEKQIVFFFMSGTSPRQNLSDPSMQSKPRSHANSEKQIVLAQSIVKAKYRATSYSPSGLMWLQHFLQEMGFPTPITILIISGYCISLNTLI
jgi:hypothetical protein